MDHTVLPAINTMPALPRKRSPDGASTDAVDTISWDAIDTRLDRQTCHCDTSVPLWFGEMGNINIGDFGRSYIIVSITSVLHVRVLSVYRRLVTREKYKVAYKLRHDPRTTQNDNDKLRKLPTW